MASMKPRRDQEGGKAVVPHSWCLLQAVEELFEPAHQMRVCGVTEASDLRVVDDLRECAMEEGILDAELLHEPTPGYSQSQHSSDGGRLDNGVEGLIIVHPKALSEPLKDPTCLVPVKTTILLELVLEDPIVGDNIDPRRSRN
jgi:hypothetical protein